MEAENVPILVNEGMNVVIYGYLNNLTAFIIYFTSSTNAK